MHTKIETSKYSFEKEVINNPAAVYAKLKARLGAGPLTPMPEFEEVVQDLLIALEHPFIQDLIHYDKMSNYPLAGFLACHYHQTIINLRHVALKVELNQDEIDNGYPHRPLASDRYPYQPTLEAISKALDFFDIVTRIAHNNNYPLYHSDRYMHYELFLKHTSEVIIIPFAKSLSLEDLIRIRSYPLAIVGISTKTLFADAYTNSPKDFWVHDINHNRRFISYNNRYCDMHQCTKEEAYLQFEHTINTIIMPSIKIESGISKEEVHLRQIMKAFYFEFLHEYAFTPDIDSLRYALKFKSGDPAPFEIMLTGREAQKVDQRKVRRLPNNNLISGVLSYAEYSGKRSTLVKYIHDEVGPNLVTSLYNKLTHSFYDCVYSITDELPPLKERTPELIAEATLQVMTTFNLRAEELGLSKEQLILLAKNQDTNGKNLGGIELYPHDKLVKTVLKREIVEQAILPARNTGLESSSSLIRILNDDNATVALGKADIKRCLTYDGALSTNTHGFFQKSHVLPARRSNTNNQTIQSIFL